jgi:hypothetical protein
MNVVQICQIVRLENFRKFEKLIMIIWLICIVFNVKRVDGMLELSCVWCDDDFLVWVIYGVYSSYFECVSGR